MTLGKLLNLLIFLSMKTNKCAQCGKTKGLAHYSFRSLPAGQEIILICPDCGHIATFDINEAHSEDTNNG